METVAARLVPYQLKYLADLSPRKCIVKSRRVGGSEVIAVEIACAAAGIDLIRRCRVKPRPQGIVSASTTQAKKLLARVAHILRGMERVAGPLIKGEPMATVVRMRNGVTIEAFSTRAASLRGDGCDMTLDEFAVLPRAEEMWQAVMPMINPTLGNPDGYKLRVCFTPLGDDGMAYEVARGKLAEKFSQHQVDIYQAVAEGFPLRMEDDRPGTIDDLREEIGDPDRFAQEYECSFLSANLRYISADLYDRSLYDFDDFPNAEHRDFAGMDVARKRHNSAIARGALVGDTLWHMGTEARREEPWEQQEQWVAEVMNAPRMTRMCVDETGIGSQFTERLRNLYGSRVEGIAFTQQSKEELANGLKLAHERGRIRMRADDVATRRDVLSLRRMITTGGNVRFDAAESKDGHADRAWAVALMVQAAGGATRAVSATGGAPTAVESDARRLLGGTVRRSPFG